MVSGLSGAKWLFYNIAPVTVFYDTACDDPTEIAVRRQQSEALKRIMIRPGFLADLHDLENGRTEAQSPASFNLAQVKPFNYNILGKVAGLRLQAMLPRKSFGRLTHRDAYRSDASGVPVTDDAEVGFQLG